MKIKLGELKQLIREELKLSPTEPMVDDDDNVVAQVAPNPHRQPNANNLKPWTATVTMPDNNTKEIHIDAANKDWARKFVQSGDATPEGKPTPKLVSIVPRESKAW